jgi:hypothetical protein
LRAPGADSSPPTGLDSLDESALYGELANRGLDDLLKRAMDTDGVSAAQRSAMASISSLHRLENDKNLTDDQRQVLLESVVAGLDQILDALHGDPALIVNEAKVIVEQGVDPQTGILEYWGESDVEKARLRPFAAAALKMYDQAAQLANAQATDLANRITSPDDKLADAWRKASDLAAAAEYQKARMQYALALAMDSNDPHRDALIRQSLKAFSAWDNADSGIQPQVRLIMAKLHVLTGDKDEIAEASKLLNSIILNPDNAISPSPSAEMVFEAQCYSVIADLLAANLSGAESALADATGFQQVHFPDDPDQAAALRLLRYRLLAAKADQSPPGATRDAANTAAVAALAQLIHDFPNLREAIFRQLAARLPANPDLTKLDPMLLLALVDEGRQSIVAARGAAPADTARVQEAAAAAQEILSRLAAGNFPRAQAVDASFLLGIFQENLGQKTAAVNSLLNHVEQFGKDPGSHADVALDRAGALMDELQQGSPADPQVKSLEERFLPIAINPPFNRRELALRYAAILYAQGKWAQAVEYYQLFPASQPPARVLTARYGQMLALRKELEASGLQPEQRAQWTGQIQKLADEIDTLAHNVLQSSASDAEKSQAKSTLAQMSLVAADMTRTEANDPKRVLRLLDGFENSVQGLPNAKELLNGALFLRVQAYMQLGQNNDATQTLVQYLSTTTPDEGEQTVHDLLATLNKDLDQARAEADAARVRNDSAAERVAEANVRQLADNRAILSGFLVKWAAESPDPKIQNYAYIYRRFDADTKRLAGELETDPAARQRDLAAALQLYKDLQSPQNFVLYQAGIKPDSGIDKDYPDPLVTLGIGLIAFDQGDCHTVKSTLGRLIQDEKLGENNDQYWEAAYKLLDCMQKLAKSGDPDTTQAQVQQSLKVLYLIWRDGTGGPKYHDQFEALRKEILPDWTPPPAPAGNS